MKRLCAIALTVLALAGLAVPTPADEKKPEVVKLFNGKDLTNFYTYLVDYGKNNDPKKVFTVVDGAIRVSGEVYGAFITEKEYGNYHLVAEFKWGEKTFAPRAKGSRDSGILIHGQGPDGTIYKAWMSSIEIQMMEGATGDLLVLSTPEHQLSLTMEAEMRPVTSKGGRTSDQPYFKPGATPKTMNRGRVNWWGRDPNHTGAKDFRGKDDVEKPVGEWNKLEIIADGDTITAILNDKLVNKGTKCNHTKGKIIVQSEGAEVFFRRFDLLPVK